MSRVLYGRTGLLVLAGAVLLATPVSGLAQRVGFARGHIGGAYFAHGAFAGYHAGGYHSGFGRTTVARGSYPYYGGAYSSSYFPYYEAYPYVGEDMPYDLGDGGDYGPTDSGNSDSANPPLADYESRYPPGSGPVPRGEIADVTVYVPPDATVWFEGTLTTPTGAVRHFQSPPLAKGLAYVYTVRARWKVDGHEETQSQDIEITAGAHVVVHFPAPAKPAGKSAKRPNG